MSEAFAASGLVRAIGVALLEFFWQGAAIGAATAILLVVLRRSAPQWRYIVACAGLAAMAIAPVATTVHYLRDSEWGGARSSKAAAEAADAFVIHPTATGSSAGAGSAGRSAGRSRQWLEPRLPFVVLVWTSGVALLALHLSFGWFRLRRIRAQAILLAVERWPAAVQETARRFGLTRLRLLVSSVVDGPAVIGFVRPAIVVPASALAGLSPAHLDAILIHELAHLRRGDYLVNVAQCGVEILLFYHPAVWWVSNQIRREREHCCDDVAASLSADRVTYARALMSMEELRVRAPRLAVGAGGGELLHRIRRVLAPQTVERPRLSGGFAMSVVAAIALLVLNAQIGSSSRSTAPQTMAPGVELATGGDAVTTDKASTMVPQTVVRQTVPPARPAPVPRTVTTPPRVVALAESVRQTQAGTGNLNGIVEDQQDGVVPGANVSVTQGGTIVRTLHTDARGRFAVTDLPGGAYELTVSLPGFRNARYTVQVPSGQTLTIRVSLVLGSLAETVTVGAGYGAGRPPRQVPANPQTADDYFAAARALYEQSLYEQASAMTSRALALLRAAMPEPGSPVPETAVSAEGGMVRVGGSIKVPKKINHVAPIYPADAAAAGVEGTVVLEAVLDKDGAVKDITVVRSVPRLDEAAANAVRMWVFTPTLLNNVPVEVAMTVTVNFTAR